MRRGNPRSPLLVALLCATASYLIVGRLSPWEALRSVHALYHDHAAHASHWHQRPHPVSPALEATAQKPLSAFDGIVLSGAANVSVAIGEPTSVSLEAADTVSNCASTNVVDGTLVLDSGCKAARLLITVPHLHTLHVDGTGNVTLAGLRDPISITVSGPGNVKASGSVESVELVVTGPGNFELSSLDAKDAKIVLMGPGNAAVSAARNLNATILGSGTIRYLGDPRVTENVLGPGSIGRIRAI